MGIAHPRFRFLQGSGHAALLRGSRHERDQPEINPCKSHLAATENPKRKPYYCKLDETCLRSYSAETGTIALLALMVPLIWGINMACDSLEGTAPEARLGEMIRIVGRSIPYDLEKQRREIACRWLNDLHRILKDWNDALVKTLRRFPGFQDETNPSRYSKYNIDLDKILREESSRSKSVHDKLCAPIKILNRRFDEDFAWLREANPDSFEDVKRIMLRAYDGESEVLLSAYAIVSAVKGSGHLLNGEYKYIEDADVPQFQIDNRKRICALIEAYEKISNKAMRSVEEAARDAGLQLTPIEESDVSSSPGYANPNIFAARPQGQHRHLYTLLSFAFGVVFIATLLSLAVAIPEPTAFQLRVFVTVLAIAAAGAATVMTGLIDVRATFGKQLVIGATGALAVFVIVFFNNPAVLQ